MEESKETRLTEEVNLVVAVTEPARRLAVGEIDPVGREVSLGIVCRKEIVVAHIDGGVPEHVDPWNGEVRRC